jgi:subtilisin family serine protease
MHPLMNGRTVTTRAPRVDPHALGAALLLVLATTFLAGCDNGPFAVQTRTLPEASTVEPDDLEYTKGNQWYLDVVSAPAAWGLYLAAAEDSLGGRTRISVPVAVIDSGIDGGHVDLAGTIASVGVDLVGPWVTPIPNGFPATFEGIDHGTHVSGLIAARGGNGVGIAGIASGGTGRFIEPPAVVVPVRALRGLSGTLVDLIEGLVYVAGREIDSDGLPQRPVARVINMSLGAEPSAFGDAEILLLESAVQAAVDAGVLVVAAAGNGMEGIGRSDGIDIPARFPSVIAVGSVDRPETPGGIVRSRFSDYGLELELVAPGAATSGWDGESIDGIVSTWPGNRYATLPGTSMASPLVAGGAALVWSANPGLSAVELRRILQETAVDIGEPGRDEEFGYGLLDVEAALRVALTTPWGPFEQGSVAVAPTYPDTATRTALRRSLNSTLADAAGSAADGVLREVMPSLLVYALPGTTNVMVDAILQGVDEPPTVASLGILPGGPLFVVSDLPLPADSSAEDPRKDPKRLRNVMETLAGDPRVLTIAVDRPINLR